MLNIWFWLEAIALRLAAIVSRLETIALKLEAILSRLEAITLCEAMKPNMTNMF